MFSLFTAQSPVLHVTAKSTFLYEEEKLVKNKKEGLLDCSKLTENIQVWNKNVLNQHSPVIVATPCNSVC